MALVSMGSIDPFAMLKKVGVVPVAGNIDAVLTAGSSIYSMPTAQVTTIFDAFRRQQPPQGAQAISSALTAAPSSSTSSSLPIILGAAAAAGLLLLAFGRKKKHGGHA